MGDRNWDSEVGPRLDFLMDISTIFIDPYDELRYLLEVCAVSVDSILAVI